MGIETIAAIATATAAVAGTAYEISNKPGAPNIAAPPQASKTPDASAVRNQLAAGTNGGGTPGIAQTFLTGTQGVDPSLLNLGRNTLLGGTSASPSVPAPPGLG